MQDGISFDKILSKQLGYFDVFALTARSAVCHEAFSPLNWRGLITSSQLAAAIRHLSHETPPRMNDSQVGYSMDISFVMPSKS
jgi:hypothetical protein